MANVIALILGGILAVMLLVFIILIATKKIHFGSYAASPGEEQVLNALKSGVKLTTKDSAGQTYNSTIQWLTGNSMPGINLSVVSEMTTANGTKISNIGGETLNYKVKPGSSGSVPKTDLQGIQYTIRANGSKTVIVYPDMTTLPAAATV